MGNIKKTTRYYMFCKKVNISKRVNGFLYFLRKIPWLGKKISSNVYRSYDLKQTLFVMVAIFSILSEIGLKVLYIAGSAFLVDIIDSLIHPYEASMELQESLLAGVFVWFVLTVLYMNIYNIWNSAVDLKTLQFIDNFNLEKKSFIKSKTLIDAMLHAIYYIPIAIITGWLLDSLIIGFSIPMIYLVGIFISNYLARLVSSRYFARLQMMDIILMIGSAVVALIVGILLPIFIGVAWFQTAISSPVGLILNFIIAFVSLYAIITFKREDYYLSLIIQRSVLIDINVSDNAILTSTTKNIQNKMTVTDSNVKFCNKKGSSYLNALLFNRCKREFQKIILLRLIASAIIIVAFIGLNLFVDDLYDGVSDWTTLLNLIFIPVWVSLFSVGRKVVQTVFLNCDNAMLHYPFYRTKKVILSGFYDRLKRTFLLNGVLAIAPIVIAFIIGFNTGFSFIMNTFVVLISLLALFSFHELFLYYILQPFADDMQVKNPLYSIITGISSFALWIFIGSSGDAIFELPMLFTIILVIVTAIYIVIGLILIAKFAKKTFKAKD